MDKKKLHQYKSLLREIPKLKKDIANLEKRLSNIPVVAGKVMKSSDNFPYIEEHLSVEMQEPKLATELKMQIKIKEELLERSERDKTAIEKFISEIPNSNDRQVFGMYFLENKKQQTIARILGYERSSISKIVNKYL